MSPRVCLFVSPVGISSTIRHFALSHEIVGHRRPLIWKAFPLAFRRLTTAKLKDGQSQDNNKSLLEVPSKIENATPTMRFWTAAKVEFVSGLFGCLICTVCRLPALGSNFSPTLNALVQSIKIAVPFSLLFWFAELIPSLRMATDERFRDLFEKRSLPDIAIFCMCVSFGEELLFRSCILGGLCVLGLKPFVALIISALVFGIFHAYTPIYIILASIAGFLLGAMFLKSSSLLQPLIVHFLYDFITILVMKLRWYFQSSWNSN